MRESLINHPAFPQLLDQGGSELQRDLDLYGERAKSNIENYVGTARIPVGLAGPVMVNGEEAQGEFFIPMATTEGTLVASTSRGMKIINESGGASVRVVRNGGIQRSPVFEFGSIDDAYAFSNEMSSGWSWLIPIAESTTSHGKVLDVHFWQMARLVAMRVSMDPGDAAGQNMVSIATQAMVVAILEKYPSITRHLMAGGLSGEKVNANLNALLGRGKGVAVSVSIPADVLRRVARAEIADIIRLRDSYMNFSMLAGNNNSHLSHINVLTAIFIAAGQDPATLPETGFAQTMLHHDTDDDQLLWEVYLPNVNVGTIGGGTGLPTQRECLEIMGCYGAGKVRKLTELCAVASLGNEISFWGSVCAQEWVSAHASLRAK